MAYHIEVEECIRAYFYVPANLDARRLHSILMRMGGGYTAHTGAWGWWRSPAADEISEHVHVYEVVVDGSPFSDVMAEAQSALQVLLHDNPKEQCAMAVVNGRRVTVTRKDN